MPDYRLPRRASLGRRHAGPYGDSVEVLMPYHPTTVAAWFLRCPGQSPAWDCYALSIVHLRPAPGMPEAIVHVPGSTHELLVTALDPQRDPQANRPRTWRHLTPINVCQQLQLPDDKAAAELAYQAALAVVAGILPAEPPLSGQVEPWRTTLIKSAAHLRGEEHAP